jgi:hypothetical protein
VTREDSIRKRTWVTDDGRYLIVDEITDDHLRNIRHMLCTDMTPGYDQAAGRVMAQDFMANRENLLDYTIDGTWAELDRDAYASAWLQIIDDEFARRQTCQL